MNTTNPYENAFLDNTLSINYTFNFISVTESTLRRAEEAKTDIERMGILDRQTIKGLKWSLEFVKSLKTDVLTDKELKHAIRLTHFRGNECPEYV